MYGKWVSSTACTLAVLMTYSASALDADRNGMSDVWEGLYPAALDPAADPDGDGVSNLDESLAWTDPSISNSVFRLSASTNATTIEWTGEAWMRYQVRSGSDLQEWLKADAERTGTNATEQFSFTSSESSMFFRVQALSALNSDTDALTNLEEYRLGTNPERWDSDNDKVGDGQEVIQGTDPMSVADMDEDGLPDDWEQWIISAKTNDAFSALSDVVPSGDFDGDGVLNSVEYALGTSPVMPRRTIVFFLSEDQSYHLGCLGTVGLDTPNLDQLGTGGVIFDRAFSLSSVCSPSKMAMYTGTYPHMNSAYRNVQNYGTAFPLVGDPSSLGFGGVHEDLPTLIEILRDRGYFTAICHKSHVQPIRKFPYHEGYGQPKKTADAAGFMTDALSQAGDRPLFFLFGIGAPHLPFRGVAKAQGKWSATGGLTGDGHVTNVDANSIEVPACYPDVPGVRQDIADYYGAIECVDAVYGSMFNALGTEANNTLVLFSGDHGIGLHRAKQSIYGAGTHVPFLFGGVGVANGIRSSEPVSHLDIVPTLLEFSGIPLMPLMHGKSLWPILSGAESVLPGRETILTASHRYMDSRAVCDGRYYYIRNIRKISGATLEPLVNIGNTLNTDQWQGGSPWFNRTFEATRAATGSPQRELLRQLVEGDVPDEELYDMENDLWMTNNLAATPSMIAVLDRLRAELVNWRQQTEDYNFNNNEVVRRTERFTDLFPGGAEPQIFKTWNFDTSGDSENWTTFKDITGLDAATAVIGSAASIALYIDGTSTTTASSVATGVTAGTLDHSTFDNGIPFRSSFGDVDFNGATDDTTWYAANGSETTEVWTPGIKPASNFLAFTLTADLGSTLDMSGLTFNWGLGSNSTASIDQDASYEVYASVDGGAFTFVDSDTIGSTAFARGDWIAGTSANLDLSGLSSTLSGGNIEFHVHGLSLANEASGVLAFEQFQFNGNVAVIETVLTAADITGTDPQIRYNNAGTDSNLWLAPTGTWTTLEIRLRQLDGNPADVGVLPVSFSSTGTLVLINQGLSNDLNTGEINVSGGWSITTQSNEWIRAIYDISSLGSSTIKSLRIDPIGQNPSGIFEVDSIRLLTQ
jgi:N-sulfoglucosamine sulfohydrolase